MSDAAPPRRRRSRLGCLGCLPSLVLLLVGGLAAAAVVVSIMGPWIYTVGGRHRPLPIWEGVGAAAGPGGTYRLYLWFTPSSSGQRILPETAVAGYSVLCTPRGERFNLKLYGAAPGRAWLAMDDGHAFNLNVFRRLAFGDVTGGGPIGPPRLEFEGHWQGSALAMTDEGSFARAFNPDGTLNPKGAAAQYGKGAVPITFTETRGLWLTAPAC